MGESHDRAARRIAKRLGGSYNASTSPDVKGRRGRAEVKRKASEIPKALRQLAGGRGPAYIALPLSQHPQAKRRLRGLKTGLMTHGGRVTKRSTRKRR